ncbi:unnamed protein product [Urochloa decumbens]|uniref:Transposase (putative) gypsy type domain-containing protein n=1 Tax=Urochloa decumbens TaxID=240449 RepID=A0ABC9DTF8_9POAL
MVLLPSYENANRPAARRPTTRSSVATAMPSSSSSSVQILGPTPARTPDATTIDTSDSDDGSGRGGGGRSAPTWPAAERKASSLRSQKALDAICRRHGVDTREFAPLPAGDRRACSPPPPGAICVYADALEAGMRVPLRPFFAEVLTHFGLAPSQLMPNCWRVMAAFAALCRSAGVHPPPVAVFRHFFALRSLMKSKGQYFFASKDTEVSLFTGLPDSIKGWKEGFFFLMSSSSAPWPCPVLWGEPTKKSMADPMLTSEEKGMVEKLLRVRGGAAIDVRTYVSEDNFAAATTIPAAAPKPPPPSPPRPTTTAGAKGMDMDPSTYATIQKMRAEKAAAAAPKVAVKSEPGGGDEPDWAPSTGKKRKLAEDNAPPGFQSAAPRQDRKPVQHAPDRHDGDTVDWEAARQLLQGIVTPARERAFLVANPFNVIASSYVATLQAANYASASLGHALKLQEELEKARAELAEAKKAAAEEVESAKAAAVQEFLGSEEHERRLVEEALKGYERGMEDMKRVALRLRPDIDPARLAVPPGGFR